MRTYEETHCVGLDFRETFLSLYQKYISAISDLKFE